MVDLALIGYSAIATLCMAVLIVVVVNRDVWLPAIGRMVSTISRQWQASLDRARAQKARRDALYGWGDMSSPELVLSQDRTSSNGGSSGSYDPVLGHQHHAEPGEPDESEPARESFARQLEKEELIILLAVQRTTDGAYTYSANQITAFVGGAAAPIKATIANVRGKKETPRPAARIDRPANGWGS